MKRLKVTRRLAIMAVFVILYAVNCRSDIDEMERESAYQMERRYIHGVLGDIGRRSGKYKDAKNRTTGIGGLVRYFFEGKDRKEIFNSKRREDMWKSIAESIIAISFEEEDIEIRRSMNERLKLLMKGCGYYRNEKLTVEEKASIRESLKRLHGKDIGSIEVVNIMYKMMKVAGKDMDFLKSFVLNKDISIEERRWMSLAIVSEVKKPAYEFFLDILDNCDDKMIRKYISSALGNLILRYGVDDNGRIRCEKQ